MNSNKIILAVDDMPENLTLLRSMLKDYFDVRLAKSAKMALSLLENLKVDLILLDIEMPGMSGFDFLKRLRSRDGLNRKTPIIFVTTHAEDEFILNAINLGARDYLLKPIKAEALHKKLDTVFGVSKKPADNSLRGKLNALMDALSSADGGQAENLLKEISTDIVKERSYIQNTFKEMADLIQAYEYEKGMVKVQNILNNLT